MLRPETIHLLLCIFKVASSPVDLPQIKYGSLIGKADKHAKWSWLEESSTIYKCSEKVHLITLYFTSQVMLHIEISKC